MSDVTIRGVIDDHRASLNAELEDRILELITDTEGDVADLALRRCHCGREVDGFYDYADHLIDELKKAGFE